jgi:hypothetical protein
VSKLAIFGSVPLTYVCAVVGAPKLAIVQSQTPLGNRVVR